MTRCILLSIKSSLALARSACVVSLFELRVSLKMRFIYSFILSQGLFLSQVAAAPSREHVKGKPFSVGEGVRTSSGLIIGKPASSRPEVSEYLGIPFAKPPVGDLRFAAPQAYRGKGTVNATVFVSQFQYWFSQFGLIRFVVAVSTLNYSAGFATILSKMS